MRGQGENRWAILCADVHPTYGSMLDDEGGFVGHGLSPRYLVREGTGGAWLQVWKRPPQ